MSEHSILRDWEEKAHWKSNAPGTIVHPLHVHVRAKQSDGPILIPIGLHAFEEGLGIMEHRGAGFEVERSVCKGVRLLNDYRRQDEHIATHKDGSAVYPTR